MSGKKTKPASNSIVAQLTVARRELLEQWLFEENISFPVAVTRCKKEFGIEIAHTTLVRFYKKQAPEHNLQRIMRSVEHAQAVIKAFGNRPQDIFEASVRIIGQVAFDIAMQHGAGKKPDLGPLYAAIPLLLAARKDRREEDRLALERERWEFDVVRLCHEHFAELQAITADKSLDDTARMQAIRRRLFGKNPAENGLEVMTATLSPG